MNNPLPQQQRKTLCFDEYFEIFQYLQPKELYTCSTCCKLFNNVFRQPYFLRFTAERMMSLIVVLNEKGTLKTEALISILETMYTHSLNNVYFPYFDPKNFIILFDSISKDLFPMTPPQKYAVFHFIYFNKYAKRKIEENPNLLNNLFISSLIADTEPSIKITHILLNHPIITQTHMTVQKAIIGCLDERKHVPVMQLMHCLFQFFPAILKRIVSVRQCEIWKKVITQFKRPEDIPFLLEFSEKFAPFVIRRDFCLIVVRWFLMENAHISVIEKLYKEFWENRQHYFTPEERKNLAFFVEDRIFSCLCTFVPQTIQPPPIIPEESTTTTTTITMTLPPPIHIPPRMPVPICMAPDEKDIDFLRRLWSILQNYPKQK